LNSAAARCDESEINQHRVDPIHVGLGGLDRELRRLALGLGNAKTGIRHLDLGDTLIEYLPGQESLFDELLAPFQVQPCQVLITLALGDQCFRFSHGLLGLEHLRPRAAKLRFEFGRRYPGDHLPGRDLVALAGAEPHSDLPCPPDAAKNGLSFWQS
jgi:hypothetical protein